MIRFAENLNKMITAGLGGLTEAPRTEVAVGHRICYMDASGPVVSFETTIAAPIRILRVDMQPIQAGSGDPSPDNIRPISGRDEVGVWRTGINVWDEEWEAGAYSVINGIKISRDNAIRCKTLIPIMPNTQYYKKCPNPGIAWNIYYDKNKNYLGYNNSPYNSVFTTMENAYYMSIYTEGGYGTTYNNDISINYPSTDHDYHPGTVQTATIQLGQTVYGGTLDVTTGVLTVDRANIESYNGETLPGEWISDRDAYSAGATPTIGAQVVYELATPLTIQLTPAQLSTLNGQNNVWSDAGDVTLEYPYYEETEGY